MQFWQNVFPIKGSWKRVGIICHFTYSLGRELKVNRGNNFSRIKALCIAYVLFSLGLLMLKTEGQKI